MANDAQTLATAAPIEQFCIPGELVEHILLGPADDRRVLQDSPLLGDVWAAYASDPGSTRDLLITPHKDATAAQVAGLISRRISRPPGKGAKIAYLQGIVGAELTFDEVLLILVPLTQWWCHENIKAQLQNFDLDVLRSHLTELLSTVRVRTGPPEPGAKSVADKENFSSLERYIALAGLIHWLGKQPRPPNGPQPVDIKNVFDLYGSRIDEIVDGMIQLYQDVQAATLKFEEADRLRGVAVDESAKKRGFIFQVSRNRRASTALDRSVPAVKADAAHSLFQVKCEGIVWAVLDCGIDGNHDAFQVWDGNDKDNKTYVSRVRKTFDFTKIRDIVSNDAQDVSPEALADLVASTGLQKEDITGYLKTIAADAANELPTNWGIVEKLITLKTPPPPPSLHGTHVAGIIGADKSGNGKETSYGGGMCPDIRLYDFRVLGKTIEDTEFAVIAALQYIRYVNERHSFITIHGANLSLSIPHNVRNFACGRTPVCNECERLVESGVVVVAAAGNRGFQQFETKDGIFESYAAFSITDPGNGEGVITVGSTHGNWPYTYGVSFFSSRGPTGDGRLKPDLVAPGERIQSTVLASPGAKANNEWGSESGTSMAAPHVSGAAAMLLARYDELVGQPRRVKRILCESATDLGRERSFQGHGMLDVLRAFQSI